MKRVIVVVVALIVIAVAVAWPSHNSNKEETFQGWIEADMIFISPDENGRIDTLSVKEGDRITPGTPLFTLDDDLQKAEVNQVAAQVTNAQQSLDRAQTLLKTSAGTQRAFDDAEAALRVAQARLNSSQTRLARRRMMSPVAGTVQTIYFRQGEMVPAGRPVLSILPPANVKVLFFVPEARLPAVAIGDTVRIRCDGCEDNLTARVTFISRTAEYTPPVIYSLEERSKLVFMLEARSADGDKFRVGQPVSVALVDPAEKKE
jgi:HlyD family secretion protein